VDNVRIDHAKAVKRKNDVVRKLTGGVASALKKKKVEVVHEHGFIKGRAGKGFTVGAGEDVFEGERLLVCTGSAPIAPPIDGLKEALESGFAVTSREMLDVQNIPGRLAIIGGGVIGLELANYFAVAGSDVAVVEMLPEIGGAIDADIAANLRGNLEKLGVRFFLETQAAGFEKGAVRLRPAQEAIGEESIPADLALLSIGRRPQTEGAGLETVGVYMEKGAIATDAQMRTNVPGVWAAGDVNGKSMLAHTAYREADVAIGDMAGEKDAMRYDAIPQIVYTSPEAAGVGETERSAAEKGYVLDKAVLPLQFSGRYLAENAHGDGFLKLLADKRTGQLLGMHMVGAYASEIILSAAVMIGSKYTAKAAEKIVFPHPTVGEVMRDALIALNHGN
jgi:dihydrolipoamide dehydrogenase